jgi:hypothetical protein
LVERTHPRSLQERRRWLDAARGTFDPDQPTSPAAEALDPEVAESWRRCAHRLPVASTAPVELDDADGLWRDSPIRRAGGAVVEELGELAVSEDYIAAVTDGTGHIIWSAAGRSMARLAEQVNFVRGASWQEEEAGTNAPGLVLATGQPATVFATEHWCEAVSDWVCYAAPLRAPSGRLVGVLDLSTLWRRASPLALTTVVAMSRLVEQQLAAAPAPAAQLQLSVLGLPSVMLAGSPLRVTQRQLEILTILAVGGPVSFEQLYDQLYGERRVAPATLKAEMSHLRHLLGGAIESRPYRLAVEVTSDVAEALDALRCGDLEGALRCYRGQLLVTSESPLVTELRHHLDVALRTAVLARGTGGQLLRFADVHPFDAEVLERAVALSGSADGELAARLARASA